MENMEVSSMVHLMRCAGFGAPYQELERQVKGYEPTVEELLHPEKQPELALDLLHRYEAG